jgi:four helix bundle protein
MAISSFRDLRVWNAAMDMVVQIYGLTRAFPREEIHGLTTQMRRAAISVPSNIAEGHTREHTKEYLHHLSMAQASLAELQTQLEIAMRLRYVCGDGVIRTLEQAKSLAKQLYALRNALTRKRDSPAPSP